MTAKVSRIDAALSATQIQAAGLFAAGQTGRAVADACGVRPETLSVWRRSPRFLAAIEDAARARLGAARSDLDALLPDAVAVLQLSLAPQQPLEVRLKTALAVLRAAGVSLRGSTAPAVNGTGDLFGNAS